MRAKNGVIVRDEEGSGAAILLVMLDHRLGIVTVNVCTILELSMHFSSYEKFPRVLFGWREEIRTISEAIHFFMFPLFDGRTSLCVEN